MMHFYYHEEDREPFEEDREKASDLESEKKKPIVISLYYFDQVMDE